MLGNLIYLVLSVFAGLILSFFWLTFRSTKKRGDHAPYWTIAVCLFLTTVGPFLFVEVLTKLFGKDLEPAIKRAYNEGPIEGKFLYYKVRWYTGTKASALAVGVERANWGGTDQPIMSIELEKKNGKWDFESYKLLYSNRQNKDNLVMPPYK